MHGSPYDSLTVHLNGTVSQQERRVTTFQHLTHSPSTVANGPSNKAESVPKGWVDSLAGLSLLLVPERKWGEGQSRKERSTVPNFINGIKVRCLDPYREPINSPCILRAKEKSSSCFIPSSVTTLGHFVISGCFRDIPDFFFLRERCFLFVFLQRGKKLRH